MCSAPVGCRYIAVVDVGLLRAWGHNVDGKGTKKNFERSPKRAFVLDKICQIYHQGLN